MINYILNPDSVEGGISFVVFENICQEIFMSQIVIIYAHHFPLLVPIGIIH